MPPDIATPRMTPPQIAVSEADMIEIIVSNLPRMTSLPIEPDTELRALGADSLTRLCIAADIFEATGRYVPDCEVERWETVADVARVLGAAA